MLNDFLGHDDCFIQTFLTLIRPAHGMTMGGYLHQQFTIDQIRATTVSFKMDEGEATAML
jgi:hypothetical protein